MVLLTSCGNKIEIVKCDSNISNYSAFNYEILEKELIEVVDKDSLFHADILIKKLTKDSMITMDSVGCYCLAICKKESLIDARFYGDKIGYEIAKKYNINEFSATLVNVMIDNNIDLQNIWKYALLSFHENDYKQNWINGLNSDNFSMLWPRQIETVESKHIKTKLIIE